MPGIVGRPAKVTSVLSSRKEEVASTATVAISQSHQDLTVANKIAEALLPLTVDIASLTPDPRNARLHPEKNLEALKESLNKFGQVKPVVVRREGMVVMAGNGTLAAARALGWTKIAATIVDFNHLDAIGYGLADNRTAELAEWDPETLASLNQLLALEGEPCIGWYGDDLERVLLALQTPPPATPSGPNLAERFGVPPFSVLDARQGYWQDRKRAWLSLGIKSELGRGEDLQDHNLASVEEAGSKGLSDRLKARIDRQKANNGLLAETEQARTHYRACPGGSPRPATQLGPDGRTQRGSGTGRPLAQTFGSGRPGDLAAGFKGKTLGAVAPNQGGKDGILTTAGKYAVGPRIATNTTGGTIAPGRNNRTTDGSCADGTPGTSGTSIFDPVLCELAYRWFCPQGGTIFDPFAGGSVRGLVASKLGRNYYGVDLRPEQAAANEGQARVITPDNPPTWVVGDAQDTERFVAEGLVPAECDFVFSCPPYADLERYSDDPRDLSTMGYDSFLEAYRRIIAAASNLLADNRFACFVVGDVRDKRGIYRGFVSDTIAAFAEAGLALYNEAILVTAVGSLPIRVGRQFSNYRKLGKTHQNVLVFVKGDPGKATLACGVVEVADLSEFLEGVSSSNDYLGD